MNSWPIPAFLTRDLSPDMATRLDTLTQLIRSRPESYVRHQAVLLPLCSTTADAQLQCGLHLELFAQGLAGR